MAGRGPRVVTVTPKHGGDGLPCCCCRCCTCIHFGFLKTTAGKLKMAEVIMAALTQTLLLRYGLSNWSLIGSSYISFLTTASACLLTSSILLGCYLFHEASFRLIRTSLFETAFNAVASFLYLSAGSYLAWAVVTDLWPLYQTTPFFQTYPAMTSTYVLGSILGVIHGIDAYFAYKQFRGIC